MSALWRRLILLLVLVIAVLQVIHMTLLSRLEARKAGGHRQANSARRWPAAASPGDGDRDRMLQAVRQASVLDSSGEYRIVNSLQRSDGPPVSRRDVTLVTQATQRNLPHLAELAARWKGPLSVTLFVAGASGVGPAIDAVLRLRRCHPDVRQNATFHLVYPLHNPTSPLEEEDVTSSPGLGTAALPCEQPPWKSSPTSPGGGNYAHGVPYPTNLLRNVARRNSASEFVFVLDVDLVPSAGLHDAFLTFARENRLFREGDAGSRPDDKTVYVVPAFEMREDVPELPADKASLLQLVELMEARPFYFELCWRCQKHTDYEAWQREPPSSRLQVLFEVLWRDPWEPFYIGRNSAPAYDERFRQYGFNRISQIGRYGIRGKVWDESLKMIITHNIEYDLRMNTFTMGIHPISLTAGLKSSTPISTVSMPRRKIRAPYEHMSEFETGRAIGLKEAGWSNRLIARHLCRSDAAIRQCWQKWVNNGSMQRQDGSGRPRATTEREDRAIVRMAVAAPESTLTTIQRVTGTQVSKMTINRRLRERNLRARRPLRCLPLTPVHRQVRLQWCRERSTLNCADWGRIVFSDESRFLLCPDDRRKRVWRRPGQRVDPGPTVEHHTGPQQGVMVWGAISFDSKTPLVVIPGTLTAQRFTSLMLFIIIIPPVKVVPIVLTWDGIVTKYNKQRRKEINIRKRDFAYIQSLVLKKTMEIISTEKKNEPYDKLQRNKEMEAMDRLLERCRELACDDEEGGTPDMEHRDTTIIEEIQENDIEQMTGDLTDKNGSRPGDHLIEEPPGEAIERLLESCRTSGDHNGKGHSTDQESR
ncbi:B3GNT1 [Cordylochernes scorpioides]|uniref:Beta-1,4-glucuronyltransferase 1 n=1 Tax=Cordylochernes scorpioides TaxID=51811 RepID=A0ABY6LP51_9ARAC|nr:B3GNT1 [Cordylochernes scorpioides]